MAYLVLVLVAVMDAKASFYLFWFPWRCRTA
jgi:hypothetical protein